MFTQSSKVMPSLTTVLIATISLMTAFLLTITLINGYIPVENDGSNDDDEQFHDDFEHHLSQSNCLQ